jgi:hypothetical protein
MTHKQQPPRDEDADREWALQEQALRAERLGLDPSKHADLQRYRAVMHALQQPMDENLPSDFAVQMTAHMRRTIASDTRLELWLSGALLGMLAAMLIGLVVQNGYVWLQLGQKLMLSLGWLNPWLLALVVCLVMPAVVGIVSPEAGASRHRSLP